MAGLKVVPCKTHADGNLDLEDLKTKAEKHKDQLAAFMVRIWVIVHRIMLTIFTDHLPFNFRCFRARCAGR